jgi:alpha-tubulin suppressor-like RCC1 family protein
VRSSISLVAVLVTLALLSSACVRYSFGVGALASSSSPVATEDGDWIDLAAGPSASCGIDIDRALWCWGADGNGQLGNGAAGPSATPQRVGVARWRDVDLDTGYAHACGIQVDGSLWCWGESSFGALGIGTGPDVDVPTLVDVGPFDSVAVGEDYSCAIRRDDRTLWCWGVQSTSNTVTTPPVAVPTQVGTASWSDVSAGLLHMCGVQTDGSLWCWGYNGWGQLGIGNQTGSAEPTRVGSATDWTGIGLGDFHSCGIRSGSLWCWGLDTSGITPDTADEVVLEPVQIGVTDDWLTVVGGASFACGIRRTATWSLWCWGLNDQGQLGLGDLTDRTAPTQVEPGRFWVVVDAGATGVVGAAL